MSDERQSINLTRTPRTPEGCNYPSAGRLASDHLSSPRPSPPPPRRARGHAHKCDAA